MAEVEGIDFGEVIKSINNYRSAIRSAVRGLWTGNISYDQFVYTMIRAIDSQFPLAWQEGARSVGILPGEMTPEELQRLNEEMFSEYRFIDRFARAIIAGNKESGGNLSPLFARAERWVQGYNRLMNIAITYSRSDPKLKWRMGATREHCVDCLNYNGRVYRASTWRRYNIVPRSWSLSCHGVHCLCTLEVTSERCTPGRPRSPRGG